MSTPRFQLVPGSRLGGMPGHGGVGWRLLGANNRELGRCAEVYMDAEAAGAAIDFVRSAVAGATSHIGHDAASATWTWSLEADDRRIAVSGRGFRHERECRYNLEQFRGTAPTAPASDEAPTEFPWQRTVELPLEATS